MKIIYVGPEVGDVAVRRRCRRLTEAGAEVTAYAFERDAPLLDNDGLDFVSLGRVEDSRMWQRMLRLPCAVWRLVKARSTLNEADTIYCRNLDCVLVGLLAKCLSRSKAALVYEVLDIHPLMLNDGIAGSVTRLLERFVLRRVALLVVSSSAFVKRYFEPVQQARTNWFLLENKISGDVPQRRLHRPPPAPPWTIGCFGKLRCVESLVFLFEMAQAYPELIKVMVAGEAEPKVGAVLDRLPGLENVKVLGKYSYPDDLSRLYTAVHFNWGLDLEDNFNSSVLLPNRIYEGGFFSVPLIAEGGTATGDYVAEKAIGYTIEAPLRSSLSDLLEGLTAQEYQAMCDRLAALDADCFVDTNDHANLVSVLKAAI